jgi:hypothetical protein
MSLVSIGPIPSLPRPFLFIECIRAISLATHYRLVCLLCSCIISCRIFFFFFGFGDGLFSDTHLLLSPFSLYSTIHLLACAVMVHHSSESLMLHILPVSFSSSLPFILICSSLLLALHAFLAMQLVRRLGSSPV